MQQANPSVNGASYEDDTRRCICESRMSGWEKSATWKSCLFEDVVAISVVSVNSIAHKVKRRNKKNRKRKNRKNKKDKKGSNKKKISTA